ncbi:hypothetical protein QT971_16885 [Microcoleus sp. herbarium19]|uniref:hypothetical protein n=1 Tax=unclassified Microcoleus TaxID=2642155 RepID=UPI002FD4C313
MMNVKILAVESGKEADSLDVLLSIGEQKKSFRFIREFDLIGGHKIQTDLDKTINTDNKTELSDSENEIDWNGFCFHCDAQVKIAEILDRTSTLFIPNSQLRLATPEGRQNLEADFLIFHQNKLGMLKIDRESSDQNATEDEVCGLSIDSGICLVKHYDATRCSEQPHLVVQEFLEMLSQA